MKNHFSLIELVYHYMTTYTTTLSEKVSYNSSHQLDNV